MVGCGSLARGDGARVVRGVTVERVVVIRLEID